MYLDELHPGQVAALVLSERVEAAASHHRPDALVEEGDEQRVVAAEGMADGPDPPLVHLGQGCQQIHSPDVVVDSLHRPAGVPQLVRIALRVSHVDVVRRQHHPAPPGQLLGVVPVRPVPEACRNPLPQGSRGVQRENGRSASRAVWQEQVGRNRIARQCLVSDQLPPVALLADLIENLQPQWRLGSARKRAGHRLEARYDMRPALRPLRFGLHRVASPGGIEVVEQVVVVRISRNLRRSGRKGACQDQRRR